MHDIVVERAAVKGKSASDGERPRVVLGEAELALGDLDGGGEAGVEVEEVDLGEGKAGLAEGDASGTGRR